MPIPSESGRSFAGRRAWSIMRYGWFRAPFWSGAVATLAARAAKPYRGTAGLLALCQVATVAAPGSRRGTRGLAGAR
jgi:hypothetical protein